MDCCVSKATESMKCCSAARLHAESGFIERFGKWRILSCLAPSTLKTVWLHKPLSMWPRRLSLKRLHGIVFLWPHHLQGQQPSRFQRSRPCALTVNPEDVISGENADVVYHDMLQPMVFLRFHVILTCLYQLLVVGVANRKTNKWLPQTLGKWGTVCMPPHLCSHFNVLSVHAAF